MAALAYLFPPLSGLVAYFGAARPRTRFHGLQAIVFGLLWPASLLVCSVFSTGATQIAFFVGLATWVVLALLTAFGKEPRLPVVGRVLKRWAEQSPRAL